MPARRPSALVVDDYAPIRDLLHDALELSGYEVAVAEGGREALEKARGAQPDVIVLDIRMPQMTGNEVLDQLREDAVCKDIPVVVVTGDRRAQAPGANALVRKPFDLRELVRVVDRVLPMRPGTAAPA